MAAITCLIFFLSMNSSLPFALQRSSIVRRTLIGPSARRTATSSGHLPSSASAITSFPSATTTRAPLRAASSSTTASNPSSTSTMAAYTNKGIIMVLSPAKTMDLRPLSSRDYDHADEINATTISQINNNAQPGVEKLTKICDAEKTAEICKEMKSKKEGTLKKLLGLSDNLAKVALQFWSDFNYRDDLKPNDGKQNDAKEEDEYRPAIYTFSGPAFQGLAPSTLNEETHTYLAKKLFILDPVYGVLSSLQGMQPYRLEMGCKLFGTETLAMFWRESVTNYLCRELANATANCEGGNASILVNLASEEYSNSIHVASLPPNTIYLNVVFRHKGRVMAVYAKRARGMMARYLAENEASTMEDVSGFDLENYACVELDNGAKWEEVDVVGDNVRIVRMIFDRDDAPPKQAANNASGKRSADGAKKASKRTKK